MSEVVAKNRDHRRGVDHLENGVVTAVVMQVVTVKNGGLQPFYTPHDHLKCNKRGKPSKRPSKGVFQKVSERWSGGLNGHFGPIVAVVQADADDQYFDQVIKRFGASG